MSSDIFSTIAAEDYLELLEDSKPKSRDVARMLDFRKEDVSQATGVSLSSIRYDQKIPAQLQEKMREWANLLNLVAEHFHGNAERTFLWLTMPNPLLGDIAPRDMIRFGRYNKLLKFVVNAINENKR
ncbi:MAG: hypothetical protein A3D28_03905 [Omnitrophica bacterium RIFCSPHIGHO2_02_FULL_63_14]|nr:MAG: hypothetical protein A3D28_03905 [Omnitrophica bacterium RIFCSPHIGHO2_02_FULL_63_14]